MATSPDTHVRTDVLIIGGGGCGLAAAIMLADAGVEPMLVERHESTAVMPKAHILNPRTMEIFHQHGLADEVYLRGASQEENCAMRWLTSLGGDEPWDRQEIHSVDAWGGRSLTEHYRALTAFRHGNLPQILLEPLLKRHARERNPGRIRFGEELIDFQQDENGVTATIGVRASRQRYRIRARYVIAADGGKTVGDKLGIRMLGPAPFVETVNVYFRADLSAYLSTGDACVRSIIRPNPDGEWTRTGLIAMGPDSWGKNSAEWVATVTLPSAASYDQFDEAMAAEAVRERLHLPSLKLEILRFSQWRVEGVCADRYREGRIFLAGDAAHRHSPMGGLGLNSGIQDAHNLAWKLAAVLKGQAGAGLLTSYETERRPVAKRNVEFATFAFFNHLTAGAGFGTVANAPAEYNREILTRLFADTLDGATRRVRLHETFDVLRLESRAPVLEMGFEYDGSPAVVDDGTPPARVDPTMFAYRPHARPGARLPHAWIDGPDGATSTHHLLRPARFLMLAGSSAAWEQGVGRVRDLFGIDIDVTVVGDGGLADRDGSWRILRGHDDDGVVLVRPDGHVMYRGVADTASLVDAMSQVLARPQVAGEPHVRDRDSE